MWGPAVVTVAPAAEPLTRADAKAHLTYEDTDKDTLIDSYSATARAMVEAMTGTRLYTQTVSIKTDDWADLAHLPIAPVQSITSITHTDTDGVSQTLATTVYEARLDRLEPGVVLKYGQSWPNSRPGSLVTVTAVVGYGVAGAQPPDVMHAVKVVLADLFAFRESAQIGSIATSIPSMATVDALLANHRLFLI